MRFQCKRPIGTQYAKYQCYRCQFNFERWRYERSIFKIQFAI